MTQGPLPVILLAANEHPDSKFRAHLWSRLDAWLETQSSAVDQDCLVSLLSREKGTFLEPFRLEGNTRRMALFLARLALSETSSASRFRLVSEDTIGNSGGLVITKSGKAFYSERYSLGKNRLFHSDVRFFAPSMLNRASMRSSRKGPWRASMHSDDKGMYVELSTDILESVGWLESGKTAALNSLPAELLRGSHIGPKKVLISSIGVGVEGTDRGIRLAVKSPEALIRFSGYVVKSQSIRLISKSPFQLSLQLPDTAEGFAQITVIASDGFAQDWVDVKDLGAPALEQAEIEKIVKSIFHHSAWLD